MPPHPTDASLATLIAVAGATPDGDVLAAAVQNGPLARYGALRVAVYVADQDGAALRMVGHSGGDEVRRLYGTLPVDESTPNAVAFRTDTELFLSLTDAADQYPLMAAATAVYDAGAQMEIGFLPLRHTGRPLGVVGILFSPPLERTWESRAALDAVCATLALWCAAHGGGTRASGHSASPTLTDRQRDILRLASGGLTNGQIAAQLGFAESTVKADLTHLYRMTGARSRTELLRRTSAVT